MCCGRTATAQFVAELFVNDQNVAYEIWLGSKLGLDGKLGVFSYNRFRITHADEDPNGVLSWNAVNYNLTDKLAVIGGGLLVEGSFAPLAGVAYLNVGERLLVYAAPYLLFGEDLSGEVFGQVQYRPAYSERLTGFHQLLLTVNGTDEGLSFTEAQVRTGLERNGWQYGLGVDAFGLFGLGADRRADWSVAFGGFLRREF